MRTIVAGAAWLGALAPGHASDWPDAFGGRPASGDAVAPVDPHWPDVPHARDGVATRATPWTPVGRDYLIGRYQPARDPRFVRLPPRLVVGDKTVYLRAETLAAFEAMAEAARAEGVRLQVVSGTRTFVQQQAIWSAVWRGDRKVDGQRISAHWSAPDKARWTLQWIAMPATSRHHWGTDLDINSTSPAYFERSPGREQYAWLARNAARFGFCQTYGPRDEDSLPGYREEKWHWSYLPLSQPMLAEYLAVVAPGDIRGFVGDDAAPVIDVHTHYVLGIHPACR